ncbi:glycine-rich RNA-binding protein 2, mitochondrial-like [Ananas comosus]|uniref:Glycine-rich RNA-binding protein 2, mitochondrial-like n=1 Tax=Ananas comosus TaxID=4615 RepID=A0A6P5FJH1_ANACO|nr:glycine-rich RNA-binding protein 2, mitochondrial-like [Ananas comosus]
MAFARKIGNLVKQTITSNPSLYQAVRCMSSSKIFVGGLSYGTDDQGLREAFTSFGEVIEARVIMDRETGRSRGFGFVTFTSSEEASTAISGMDSKELHGRFIRVNYAADRSRSGYGGYGGGSGGTYAGSAGGFGSGGSYGGGGYGAGNGGYQGGGYGGSSYNESGDGYRDSGYAGGGNGGSYNQSSYGGGNSGNYSSGYGGGNVGYGGDSGGYGVSTGGDNYNVAEGSGGNDNLAGGAFSDSYSGISGAHESGGNSATDYGTGFNQQDNANAFQNPSSYGNTSQENQLDGKYKDDSDEPGYANKQS